MLEVWADENEVLLEGVKSWTLKNEGKNAGAEPDECWVVGDRPNATKPDLALEVVQTRGGLDKLEIYRRLGVREVWFWIDDEITIHVLRGRSHVRSAKSTLFRALDLKVLTRFWHERGCSTAPLCEKLMPTFHADLKLARFFPNFAFGPRMASVMRSLSSRMKGYSTVTSE